ncbi:MAG: DUF4846 domain-containing protein [Chitinophagaceae bacterium]
MKLYLLTTIILPFFGNCGTTDRKLPAITVGEPDTTIPVYKKIAELPLPAGYKRMKRTDTSFGAWLQQVSLKKDNRVYLYNGSLKRNQQAQFAVLDIPVGNKDLQQCADAVMRLRAEYLYSRKQFSQIVFADNNGKQYRYAGGDNFQQYLEKVFSYCGSASLQKQLKPVNRFENIQPGDVLIKGGSPGHAMLVMDVAENEAGKRIYLLAQSYMPAQDIHIVKNPISTDLSPWYEVCSDNCLIYTPEWVFTKNDLRRW